MSNVPAKPSPVRLRLVLMGTGPFAVPAFEALCAAGHEIAMVVCKPQPRVKSRRGAPPSPVRTWAEQRGFQIDDPLSINDPQAVEKIQSLHASLLVVCDYGQILKPPALGAAELGGINLHGSLLPAYRGAAPVQWALINGDSVTGVSVIHMTPKLDGGPVLVTRQTNITDRETAGELEQRLALIGVDAVLEAVDSLASWDGATAIGTPQDPARTSQARRLRKVDGEIDWSRSAGEIDCHIRGMQPWPIAYTHLVISESRPPLRVAIKEARLTSQARGGHAFGEIVEGDGLLVATADNVIEILRLQPAGKREMDGAEFLRGHQIPLDAKRRFLIAGTRASPG